MRNLHLHINTGLFGNISWPKIQECLAEYKCGKKSPLSQAVMELRDWNGFIPS